MTRTTTWLLALALLVACSGGQGSPQATLESLQSAVATDHAVRVYELHDADSRGFFRDHIRRWRASIAAGRQPQEPAGPIPLTREEITAGEEADAAAILVQRTSPVSKAGRWFVRAKAMGESRPSDSQAVVVLRGTDGRERELRFKLEGDRWAFDFGGTRW